MTKSIEYAASAATTNQDAMIQAMRRQGLRNVARYWQRREARETARRAIEHAPEGKA